MGLLDRLTGKRPTRFAAVAMAAMLLLSAGTAGVMALNFSEGEAPNPMIEADTTVDAYQVEWGDTLQYEDDSGNVVDLPARLDTSEDHADLGTGTVNPFTFTATDVEFTDGNEFPRKSDEDENSASAIDSSEWTTSGASVSDVTTAPSVDALGFSASASGDTATYSNFSVTSDAEKRYVQVFYDINSASGDVELRINDATDGDTATVMLYDADGNASATATGANTTGEGKVIQVQTGKLSASGGDAVIDEIGSISLYAGGSADVDISTLNMEKTSKYKLGERYHDDDNDDELETESVYQATGPLSLYSVDTMGDTFADSTIHGLTFPAQFAASELTDSDMQTTFAEDNAYPQWPVVADLYFRISLPSAYDLSYSNAELKQTTKWPGTRYATVELVEGASDTEFSEIDGWTDLTSSFDSEDKNVTLDSTVSVGTEYALHYEVKLTDDEANAMQQSMGGGAGPMSGSGGFFGGIISFLTSLPGIIVAGVGTFGLGRAKGWF